MPKRIQRKRTKGWKMPEGAVYVGRRTKWANPWWISETITRAKCIRLYRAWLVGTFTERSIEKIIGQDVKCPAQPLSRAGHSGIGRSGLNDRGTVLEHTHRAKFANREAASVETAAPLSEKHGTGRVQFDQDGDCDEQGREHDQGKQCADNIDQSLCRAFQER